MASPLVSDIVIRCHEASLSILGIPDKPGVLAQLLASLSDANVAVSMIVQTSQGDGTTDVTLTVNRAAFHQVRTLLEPVADALGADGVQCNDRLVQVSVVGVEMGHHPQVAGTLFACLGQEGIDMQQIVTSETKISVAIDERDLVRTMRTLHDAFGLAPGGSVFGVSNI